MAKSNKAMTWTVVLVAVLVAAGGCAYYITWNQESQAANKSKVEIFTPTVKDGSFITNLRDSKHFLKISPVIEVANSDILNEFTKKSYVVNDIIISVLNTKTYEDAMSDDFQTKLKEEIISALKQQFGESSVINIYFNEFVIQ